MARPGSWRRRGRLTFACRCGRRYLFGFGRCRRSGLGSSAWASTLTDKVFDEALVLSDVLFADAEISKLLEQRLPRGIDVFRAEAVLGREAHVSYVFEARRGTDHGLVDLSAGSAFFLLGGGGAAFGLCVLGAIADLLEEVVGLAVIRKRKADQAFVAFEGVEEGTILIVLEIVVQFVLPNDASSALEIDHLEVESGLDQVTNKGDGPLDAGVAPLRRTWVGSIYATDGGSDDLVAGRWNGGFDLGLVRRRNGGGGWHGSGMAVMLFSCPASDDDVGGERDEQWQEEETAVRKAQIDGARGIVCRGRRDEERQKTDKYEQQTSCDESVTVS